MNINDFVEMLSEVHDSDGVENPYRNEVLAHNLRIYLCRMHALNPKILLVGEAPGHKGCARTGIPFTDEERMMSSDSEVLGEKWGYRCLNINSDLEKENSATAIWNVLGRKEHRKHIPLMWNVFPFHPYKEGNVDSNRKPVACEIRAGEDFLASLVKLFPSIKEYYAVGRTAENALFSQKRISEKDRFYIRHPSHGGNILCTEKLQEILMRSK